MYTYGNEKENWRILTNKEIYAGVKKPTIIEIVRLNRLRWFGHVQRMEENRIPKRLIGRPRSRSQDGVRGWKNSWRGTVAGKVHNREEWKKVLRTGRNSRILHMPNGMNK